MEVLELPLITHLLQIRWAMQQGGVIIRQAQTVIEVTLFYILTSLTHSSVTRTVFSASLVQDASNTTQQGC